MLYSTSVATALAGLAGRGLGEGWREAIMRLTLLETQAVPLVRRVAPLRS